MATDAGFWNKMIFIRIASLLFFCFSLFSAVAQDMPIEDSETINEDSGTINEDPFANKNYFTRQTEEGIALVVQKISWSPIEYVKYYRVSVEKQDDVGMYVPMEMFEVVDPFLELTLYSGNYRFQVIPINLLGKPAIPSEWKEFSVKKAFIPQLTEVSPLVIYLDDIYDGNFSVKGLNLLPDSEFMLHHLLTNIHATGVHVSGNGRNADIVFSTEAFDTGTWNLRVRNPGNFIADIPIVIKFFKWYDFNIQAGYKPLIFIVDDTIPHYLDTNNILLGTEFRLSFIPYKRRFGYFGGGLNVTYHYLDNSTEGYDVRTNIMQAYLNFIYRLPIIKNKFSIDLHGGPGIFAVQGLMFSFPHDLHSEPFSSFYLAATAGISCHYFVYKRLYIELAADCAVAFVPDILAMSVMPSLSVGWQF